MARIPFELAEPGTDPTRKAPPRPRRNLFRENQWLLIGLLVFALVGYFKFVRKPSSKAAADPAPTPTVVPTSLPVDLFAGDGGDTGFFPTPESSAISFYGLVHNGANIVCQCTRTGDTIIIEPDVCNEYPVSPVCGEIR